MGWDASNGFKTSVRDLVSGTAHFIQSSQSHTTKFDNKYLIEFPLKSKGCVMESYVLHKLSPVELSGTAKSKWKLRLKNSTSSDQESR